MNCKAVELVAIDISCKGSGSKEGQIERATDRMSGINAVSKERQRREGRLGSG